MATTFGKYQVEREIGRGGMGVVYEAKDPSLNREVALKVMQIPDGIGPAQRRVLNDRFFQEGRALAGLSHPNIVAVLDMGEVDGRCYLAMELVRGTTLRDRIAYHGALPTGEVVRVGIALCQALEHMHQRGIVHRDIKPDNVMLLADGRVKLTDFGIAVAASPLLSTLSQGSQARHGHTPQVGPESLGQRSTLLQGSPAYMSPEQAAGERLDGRSDIFSLGTTLHEAASGRRAFPAETATALLHQVAHEPPAPATLLPPFLRAILERAMAKDPNQRYPDTAQLAADLQRQQAPSPGVAGRGPASGYPPAPLNAPWDLGPASARTVSTGGPAPSWPAQRARPAGAGPPSIFGTPSPHDPPLAPLGAPAGRRGTHEVGGRRGTRAAGHGQWQRSAPPPYSLYPDLDSNTSGMGPLAPVPAEIAGGWNWGAFFLPLFWGISHHTWIAFLCLITPLCLPVGAMATLAVAIALGVNGNRWGWQNRRWQSVAHYREVQRAWAAWGVGIFCASVVLSILFVMLILAVG